MASVLTTVEVLVLSLVTTSVSCILIEGDILKEDNVVHHFSVPGGADTWTDRQIPVYFDVSKQHEIIVKTAISSIRRETGDCVQFLEITDSDRPFTDYVNITDRSPGCYSAVGRRGGQQILNLGSECSSVGIAIHELMHALGFWHEQNRSDRDSYVIINTTNIRPGHVIDFKKRSDDSELVKHVEYDYRSIMHYKVNEFSAQDDFSVLTYDTIVIRDVPSSQNVTRQSLGQREGLSPLDIKRIKWLYGCDTDVYCRARMIPNGSVTPLKSKYNVGEVVTFRCNSGYSLIPVHSSMCKSDGQWAGALPYCMLGTINYYYYFYQDFQEDTKLWTVGDWRRHVGQAHSLDTGPHFDHTFENSTGYYLYMDARRRKEGEQISTLSPQRRCNSKTCCLLFYYNMFGSDMGTLTVQKLLWSGRKTVEAWTSPLDPQQSRGWQHALVPNITSWGSYTSSQYQVKFTATRGAGENSDIAIDDVFMADCSIVNAYYNAAHPSPSDSTGDIDTKTPIYGVF